MSRIVVIVEGGVVVAVYTGDEETEVEVVDYDNLAEDGVSSGEADEMVEQKIAGLTIVY